jgi:hypothetical protein
MKKNDQTKKIVIILKLKIYFGVIIEWLGRIGKGDRQITDYCSRLSKEDELVIQSVHVAVCARYCCTDRGRGTRLAQAKKKGR